MNAIALSIGNIPIRQDAEGRYCLNDLHKAAGGEERHSPNRFTRSESYKALVDELTPDLAFAPVESIRGGNNPGTFVCKELVYSYAMWISPKFHLTVIRAYDSMVSGKAKSEPNLTKEQIEANRLFKSNLSVAKLIFKGNQAVLSANQATRNQTHIDVLSNLGVTGLIAERQDVLLTASDIGKQMGLSGQKVNLLLEEEGYVSSYRDHKDRKHYRLTALGEEYGVVMDTGKRNSTGAPVVQIKWYGCLVDKLKAAAA